MTPETIVRPAPRPKAPSGVVASDNITYGGLPQGCSTLFMGGPGSEKTLFVLQKRETEAMLALQQDLDDALWPLLAGLRDNGIGAQP